MTNILSKPNMLSFVNVNNKSINKYLTTIGDGFNTEFIIDHNLNSSEVHIVLYTKDMKEVIESTPMITHLHPYNRVILEFDEAPELNEFIVLAIAE